MKLEIMSYLKPRPEPSQFENTTPKVNQAEFRRLIDGSDQSPRGLKPFHSTAQVPHSTAEKDWNVSEGK